MPDPVRFRGLGSEHGVSMSMSVFVMPCESISVSADDFAVNVKEKQEKKEIHMFLLCL